MAENSAIEWTDHTFNPWIGCTKVGPGCDHCYAEQRMDTRLHRVQWGAGQPRQRTKTWGDPVRWNKQRFAECMGCGWRGPDSAAIVIDNPPGFHPPVAWARGCPACRQPTLKEARARVFCASLADVFDNEVPPEWRADLFKLIAATPNLDWLLLTKRIGNARSMLDDAMLDLSCGSFAWTAEAALANVWLGATVVNQEESERDIPKLLAVPARVRFLSIEPMLGPIDLTRWLVPPMHVNTRDEYGLPQALGTETRRVVATVARAAVKYLGGGLLDWVICGGESGPGARPMHPDWARSLRDQCAEARVPFLFKQWGEWLPWHHFGDAAIDDPPERTRFDTREFVDGAWRDVGRPDYWATMDGEIDDKHCVGRVGKKAAGRLLDGRTHDGFPA